MEPQRGYRHATGEFTECDCSKPGLSFNNTVEIRCRIHLESRPLPPGAITGRLAAVVPLAHGAADADASQKFDYATGARYAGFAGLVGYRVAMETEWPKWNDGDFFGKRFGSRR
jgi:hypothetical protein